MRHAAEMLQRTLPKMIFLKLELNPELWSVKADANQLEQVLINLGTNAADAMPDGGELKYCTSNLMVEQGSGGQDSEVLPGRYVQLAVSDTGKGMCADTRTQIFDPFFTTKPVGKGTGLGLSTSFGIINEHGGHIQCQSQEGQGTTFTILLPASRTEPDVQSRCRARQLDAVGGGDETIMLVDDETAIVEVEASLMGSMGYTVISADSGERALELYQAQPDAIDLVVMDLGMPGMGGYRCLEELKKADPEVKVLIASGYTMKAKIDEAMQLGAIGFVSKPYKGSELLAAVRSALDQ